jgi:hypothetical protein
MSSIPIPSSFSLAAIKNAADELRAQVYPRNETERMVFKINNNFNYNFLFIKLFFHYFKHLN